MPFFCNNYRRRPLSYYMMLCPLSWMPPFHFTYTRSKLNAVEWLLWPFIHMLVVLTQWWWLVGIRWTSSVAEQFTLTLRHDSVTIGAFIETDGRECLIGLLFVFFSGGGGRLSSASVEDSVSCFVNWSTSYISSQHHQWPWSWLCSSIEITAGTW